MALTAGAERELKSLLHALVMLGKEETARKLQRVADTFQMYQRAAVKLAEDTISNNIIDEKHHSLEHYVQKVERKFPFSEALSWQSKVLLHPQQVTMYGNTLFGVSAFICSGTLHECFYAKIHCWLFFML